jgi:hypothetical protein
MANECMAILSRPTTLAHPAFARSLSHRTLLPSVFDEVEPTMLVKLIKIDAIRCIVRFGLKRQTRSLRSTGQSLLLTPANILPPQHRPSPVASRSGVAPAQREPFASYAETPCVRYRHRCCRRQMPTRAKSIPKPATPLPPHAVYQSRIA